MPLLAPAVWLLVLATPFPFEGTDPEVRAGFERGVALEEQGDFAGSNRLYEEVVARDPEIAHLYWRIARNHLRATQQLKIADEPGRRKGFEEVVRWAAQGSERDPECAECYLYEFIGVASLSRIEGTLSSARGTKRMKGLLDRTLELEPKHVDGDWNHELANAYFAAGVFYKVVPDVALAGWLLGARGDPELSREYYRKAFALHGHRVDVRLSLGTALLCKGQREEDTATEREGLELIRGVPTLEDRLATDAIGREHAEILLEHPERACEYSGEEWRRREGR